jgi:hypothetical protein
MKGGGKWERFGKGEGKVGTWEGGKVGCGYNGMSRRTRGSDGKREKKGNYT